MNKTQLFLLALVVLAGVSLQPAEAQYYYYPYNYYGSYYYPYNYNYYSYGYPSYYTGYYSYYGKRSVDWNQAPPMNEQQGQQGGQQMQQQQFQGQPQQ